VGVQARSLEELEVMLRGVDLAGKSVFVTGHSGFKGSWLSIWLHRLGAKVAGYSKPPPTTPSNFEMSRVEALLASHHVGDIRDAASLTSAIVAADPDVIFHMAAQPLVRESYLNPRETLEVNVIGTATVLDVVRARGKPCVVIVVTSDKCYENCEHVWGYRESDPMGGHDPYSASKGAAELVVSSYRRSFFSSSTTAKHGVKIASVRAGNVIGGGDWATDRLIPDIIRSLSTGVEVRLRNPDAVRPWQHVLDPLAGYLLLATRMLEKDDGALASGWNFGPLPGQDVPVSRLAQALIDEWGGGRWTDAREEHQPHEAQTLRLSIEKAFAHLAWRPRWDVSTSIRRTARWYARAARTQGSMLDACLEDIEAYERSPDALSFPSAGHDAPSVSSRK
jgi:CDP-glucose 4,6-dehydratase